MVSRRRRPAEAQCTRSLGLGYKLCAVISVAGQRMHGTTFRALKVTSWVATPGAESALYDCLVLGLITAHVYSVCKLTRVRMLNLRVTVDNPSPCL